jgi:hypothetical protein
MLTNANVANAQGVVATKTGITLEVFKKSFFCTPGTEEFDFRNVEVTVTSATLLADGRRLINVSAYDPQIFASLKPGLQEVPYEVLNKHQLTLFVPKMDDTKYNDVIRLQRGDKIIVNIRSAKHIKDGILQPLSQDKQLIFNAYKQWCSSNGLAVPESYTYANAYFVKSLTSDPSVGRAFALQALGMLASPEQGVAMSNEEEPF